MTLGERLRQERKARGWTQGELAAKSTVVQGVITNIETGRTPNPSIQTMQKLADALGVDLDTLREVREADLTQVPVDHLRAIGVGEAKIADLQRRWPRLSDARRRQYLRLFETTQRQLQALDETDDTEASEQPGVLLGVL